MAAWKAKNVHQPAIQEREQRSWRSMTFRVDCLGDRVHVRVMRIEMAVEKAALLKLYRFLEIPSFGAAL
jgi:hypothetical protein